MKVTDIGSHFSFKDSESIEFFSNEYFMDTEVLFVSLSALNDEITTIANRSDDAIHDDIRLTIEYWIERRTRQIEEFYEIGGVVFVVADDDYYRYFDVYDGEKDSISINLFKLFKNDDFMECDRQEGSKVIVDSLLKDIDEIASLKFRVAFELADEGENPLVTTIKKKNIVGFSLPVKNGLLIVLPEINLKAAFGSALEATLKEKLFEIFKGIIKGVRVDVNNVVAKAPEWAKQVRLKVADEFDEAMAELISESEILQAKIKLLEEKQSAYAYLKSIIYTKGRDLEVGVVNCLKHLGLTFEIPEGNNTDLMIIEGDEYFPVEIKGGNGSAAKSHVRQLEDWVNGCAKKYDIDSPKGILIINTFCETPINERNQRDFPENVIEFSFPRKHCLLTALQLLVLIDDFDQGKITKDDILNLFRDTAGVLDYS